MKFSRQWAMPNKETFSVSCIGDFVRRYVRGVVVDPFARNSRFAVYANDLNPKTDCAYHMDAVDFLRHMKATGVVADTVLFDPPYSPRQISECYSEAGLSAGMADTQSARFKREVRNAVRAILPVGGVFLSFGWNSVGPGPDFELLEVLLVCHGGDHNDTICSAWLRTTEQLDLMESTHATP